MHLKLSSIRGKLLHFVYSADGKQLAGNTGYLMLGHIATYVLALALVPYLLHTVGVAIFGMITLAQTVVSYLMLLVEYGFNLSATQEAVRLLQDKETNRAELQQLYNRVFTVRLFLLVCAAVLFSLLVWFIPLYRAEAALFFLTFLQLIGHAVYPLWLFQGGENMRLITLLNLCFRILFFVLVFVAVHSRADYLWVPALYSFGYLTIGLIGFFVAMYQYSIRLALAPWQEVVVALKNNMVLFFSNLALYLYVYAPTVLAGFLLSRQDLGYYSVAERIMTAIRHVVSAIAQAVFPVSARLSITSHAAMRSFLKRAAIIYTLAVGTGCVLLFFLAPSIVHLLNKEPMLVVVELLQVLCWMPILFVINFTFSHVLLVYKHRTSYFVAFVLASICSILLTVFLTSHLGVLGTAYAVFVTELLLMFACVIMIEVRHKEHSLLGQNPTNHANV